MVKRRRWGYVCAAVCSEKRQRVRMCPALEAPSPSWRRVSRDGSFGDAACVASPNTGAIRRALTLGVDCSANDMPPSSLPFAANLTAPSNQQSKPEACSARRRSRNARGQVTEPNAGPGCKGTMYNRWLATI